MLARLDVESGDLGRAESRLAGVVRESDDPELRLVARLRLVRVQLAQGRHDDALATLEAARQPAAEARIEELRGDVQRARGDAVAALAAYRKAQTLIGTPAMDGGMVDAELLELKIDELSSATANAVAPVTE
jgi:predicted negative regulator of RcsB-dependent stress response